MGINKNQGIAIMVVLFLIVFYGGYRYGHEKTNGDEIIFKLDGEVKQGSGTEEENEQREKNEQSNNVIFVHITGAVEKPGLYQLPQGARINEGVLLAVPTEEAYLDALNLAQLLLDGTKIVVPTKSEAAEADNILAGAGGVDSSAFVSGTAGAANLVNINIADAQQLADRLPGIGPVLAQRIIDYRTANGPFQTPEDLTKVSGIGPKIYENLKKLVVVH